MNLNLLSPLPRLNSDGSSRVTEAQRDGFVDDEVILALVAGPTASRPVGNPVDLALAPDDMDFAGWSLSPSIPAHVLQAATTNNRRPAPPELDEPGIGAPHSGSHRWWLAGLAGALSTMIFTLVLIALSNRPWQETNVITVIRPQPKAQALPADTAPQPKVAAEITGMMPEK